MFHAQLFNCRLFLPCTHHSVSFATGRRRSPTINYSAFVYVACCVRHAVHHTYLFWSPYPTPDITRCVVVMSLVHYEETFSYIRLLFVPFGCMLCPAYRTTIHIDSGPHISHLMTITSDDMLRCLFCTVSPCHCWCRGDSPHPLLRWLGFSGFDSHTTNNLTA